MEANEDVTIRFSRDFKDIEGIKSLQERNLKKLISAEECASEGFVTAEYTLEFLWEMHCAQPSVVAVSSSGSIVGYALVVVPSLRGKHQLLNELFDCIDAQEYKGRNMRDSKYVLCGQLCVAKGYRGKALARNMYDYFRSELRRQFQFCLTDVDVANDRSLKAHLKTGFQVISSTSFEGATFVVVLWDWD